MKGCFSLLLCCIAFLHVHGQDQNLVMNPDFEDENLCEHHVICSPKGWYTTLHESVTNYSRFSKRAHSGTHQLGINLFDSRSAKRSYVQTPLKCGLQKDITYKFKMYMRARNYATNCVGVYFSAEATDTITNKALLFEAQISNPSKEALFNADGDWFIFEGDYIAKGGERFMVIGNFEDPNKCRLKRVGKSLKFPHSSYYIDDVSLEPLIHVECDCDSAAWKKKIYDDSLRHPYSAFLVPERNKGFQALVRSNVLDTSIYQAGKTFLLKTILFETAKSTLLPVSFKELNLLVNLLRKNPAMEIRIEGHTDDVGKPVSNQILSEYRCRAVVDYLVQKGIQSFRLSYKGYGSQKPVTTNQTLEGRALNRRVEFRIIKL